MSQTMCKVPYTHPHRSVLETCAISKRARRLEPGCLHIFLNSHSKAAGVGKWQPAASVWPQALLHTPSSMLSRRQYTPTNGACRNEYRRMGNWARARATKLNVIFQDGSLNRLFTYKKKFLLPVTGYTPIHFFSKYKSPNENKILASKELLFTSSSFLLNGLCIYFSLYLECLPFFPLAYWRSCRVT